MTRFGIIDLGTNTFHLLIVERTPDASFRELFRERRFIKLAENGIHRIGEPAFQRGLQAIRDYRKTLEEYRVDRFRALGTAALRTADNGPDFIRQVEKETTIRIELISGEEEARLIHRGVALAVPIGREKELIMDIGGGSVEFIIADDQKVYWAASFPVGLAILFHGFHRHDPIHHTDLEDLNCFLNQQLRPLLEALDKYPVKFLIGAAGTFEVLDDMLSKTWASTTYAIIEADKFRLLLESVLPTTQEERLVMPKLPASRADMFVVALLLIDFALNISGSEKIVVSRYALKEGALEEVIRRKD